MCSKQHLFEKIRNLTISTLTSERIVTIMILLSVATRRYCLAVNVSSCSSTQNRRLCHGAFLHTKHWPRSTASPFDNAKSRNFTPLSMCPFGNRNRLTVRQSSIQFSPSSSPLSLSSANNNIDDVNEEDSSEVYLKTPLTSPCPQSTSDDDDTPTETNKKTKKPYKTKLKKDLQDYRIQQIELLATINNTKKPAYTDGAGLVGVDWSGHKSSISWVGSHPTSQFPCLTS